MPPSGPSIWIPTGKPAGVLPAGSVRLGSPETLSGAMF